MTSKKDNRVWNGNTCKCESRTEGKCDPKGFWVVKRASTCILFKDEKKAIKYNKGEDLCQNAKDAESAS